jgi:hypothetical protein
MDHLHNVFGVFSHYRLVMLFLSMARLTVALACDSLVTHSIRSRAVVINVFLAFWCWFYLDLPDLKKGRISRGIHEIPKVSPGTTIPSPSMPCGRATPKMALLSFQGRPTHRAGGLLPAYYPLGYSLPSTIVHLKFTGSFFCDFVSVSPSSHQDVVACGIVVVFGW